MLKESYHVLSAVYPFLFMEVEFKTIRKICSKDTKGAAAISRHTSVRWDRQTTALRTERLWNHTRASGSARTQHIPLPVPPFRIKHFISRSSYYRKIEIVTRLAQWRYKRAVGLDPNIHTGSVENGKIQKRVKSTTRISFPGQFPALLFWKWLISRFNCRP